MSTIQQIVAPGGDLILVRNGRPDLRIEAPHAAEWELLESLDGRHTHEELIHLFGQAEVAETLDLLDGLGALEDGAEEDRLEPAVRERFGGQIRYFGEVGGAGGPSPVQCQRRLAEASVAVLGSGGLGGRIAVDLASIGVGELWLADGDRVEKGNLARQVQFGEADVGHLKVERLAGRIRGLNSATRIRATSEMLVADEEIAAFVAGADLVVDAADWPPHEIECRINRVCFGLGIPYIAMSHCPPIARIGPLYVPGRTGCHACQESAFRRDYPLYDLVVEQLAERPIPAATLGPACGMTAGWVATEAMHFLTGVVEPTTLGVALTIDLRSAELRRLKVVPEPGCATCADSATRASARES